MPMFAYKGRNSRGEVLEGRIESPSAQAVAVWMSAVGITPVAIKQQQAAAQTPEWLKGLLGAPKLTEIELLLFTRQMGSLVRAGVPLMQALSGIQKSTRKPHVVAMLQQVRDDLDRGIELSAALARHPRSFSEFYVSMVKVGESSGQLETMFMRLHEQIQFDMDMRRKMKGALRYPMFVTIALALAVAIINIWVIPSFAAVYAQMKMDLPIFTRILIATSKFSIQYWWLVIAVIAGIVVGFRAYIATPKGRRLVDEQKLKIPIFGPLMNKVAMARYAFAFATANESGIPLVQAYTLTSKVVSNAFYEERVVQMREGVERGESIYRVAQNSGIFNPLELQMISVGEETGRMDEMLRSISRMYQEEVDFEVSRLAQTLEPIMIGGLGAIVAMLMLAVFLPMWDMTQLARQKK
jgi:MSHA biogenesis protein MshG